MRGRRVQAPLTDHVVIHLLAAAPYARSRSHTPFPITPLPQSHRYSGSGLRAEPCIRTPTVLVTTVVQASALLFPQRLRAACPTHACLTCLLAPRLVVASAPCPTDIPNARLQPQLWSTHDRVMVSRRRLFPASACRIPVAPLPVAPDRIAPWRAELAPLLPRVSISIGARWLIQALQRLPCIGHSTAKTSQRYSPLQVCSSHFRFATLDHSTMTAFQ